MMQYTFRSISTLLFISVFSFAYTSATANQSTFDSTNTNLKGKRVGYQIAKGNGSREKADVLDLCDDQDAIDFGMDGGDLEQSRISLGIDCKKVSGNNRYATKSGNTKSLFNSHSEASTIINIQEENTDEDLVEGYAADDSIEVGFQLIGVLPNSDLRFVNDSVSVVESSTYKTEEGTNALAINTSEVPISNIKVHSEINYQHPLTAQPGEYFPIIFQGDISNISIKYRANTKVDTSRFIRITGMPGFWDGKIEDYPFMEVLNRKEYLASTTPWIYTSGLSIIPDSKLRKNGQSKSSATVKNLVVLASHFDANGRLLDIQSIYPFSIYNNDDDEIIMERNNGVIRKGEELTIGIVAPVNSTSVAIWSGSKNH